MKITMQQFDRWEHLDWAAIKDDSGFSDEQVTSVICQCIEIRKRIDEQTNGHFYACHVIETAPWINRAIEAAEVAHYEG